MFSLQNKIAVITGAGSGIGKAIALLFAKQGADVRIVDINNETAVMTVNEIKQAGGYATAHICNIVNQQSVKYVVEVLSKIDILINSAGVSHIGNAENTSEKDFDHIYKVNVKGIYNFLHAVVPVMVRQRRGVIINISSIAASVGIPDRFAYSMSKGAVSAMTLSVAKDYLTDNIRCNSISPARVHTAFVDGFLASNYPGRERQMFEKLSKTQPIGRMAKPEEIAGLALYLCSDEASFITGCDFPIDGGFMKLNN
jgi:2-keto-3-deoxy-L-fuconate dehydrogenase